MIKVIKSPYVTGEPFEYMLAGTTETEPINSLAVRTSTGTGFAGTPASTYLTIFNKKYVIPLCATTGSTSKEYPVHVIQPDLYYKVDHSTAEAVVGTTCLGYNVLCSSSGAITVATTGQFQIHAVHNTSDTSAQYFVGKFILKNSTTV
jgi:hypothetical protein